jgi:hypothetical protein
VASSLKIALVLCGLLAFGCASNAAPQPVESAAPFTFEGNRARDLVLPVASFPAGTYVAREAAMAADEVGTLESLDDRATLLAILRSNGYTGGYVRTFEFVNGGVPHTRQVTVLIFRDGPAARAAVSAFTEMRLKSGFDEISLGTRIGDGSRFVGGNFRVPDPRGDRLTAAYEVVYSYLNAVVLTFIADDRDASPGEGSADFALIELRFLRDAVARQTPRPS